MDTCVLGIETSCDETAAALVRKGRILSNVVSSSVALHREYGGVVPEVASRFHIEYINRVVRKALAKAKKTLKDVSAVAVTQKPGLPGSLLVGTSFAGALSFALGIPLVKVDHLAAHIYANFIGKNGAPQFPFIGAVVSGGHTSIFIVRSLCDRSLIGRTRDDAIGEAFDKVAKILRLGYPGGPAIEKTARKYRLKRRKPIRFPMAALENDTYDVSLSGIKTAVLEHAKRHGSLKRDLPRVSWSFQESVFDVFVKKVINASRKFGMSRIVMGGGVVSNKRLRRKLTAYSKRLGFQFFYPDPSLCADNAAMVAGLGEALLIEEGGRHYEA